MARVVKNTEKQANRCDIVTVFSNGSRSVKPVKAGDILEGLRYIEDEELKIISGRVVSITASINKVTKVDPKNPKNYFSDDVKIKSIVIDCSEQYQSKIVTVDAKEIVEDEGVTDVDRVYTVANVSELITIEYTDGTTSVLDLEPEDILTNIRVMMGEKKPDLTGSFEIAAFLYKNVNANPVVLGAYLKSLENGKIYLTEFKNYIEVDEGTRQEVTNPESLTEIATALEESADGVVYATFGTDVTIPKRDDGRITTLFIGENQTLNADLAGHSLSCQAYAFYVSGGTLNISDSTGEGKIECTCDKGSAAYPAVYVASGGTCNMSGGLIDTTNVDETAGPNWLYGVVCSGDGVFNMTGGEMKIGGASGISITNGTASGTGARFTIGGNAKISSEKCAAIYLADNKSVDIKGKAEITGGIVARMGDITIEENAVVNSHIDGEQEPLGEQITLSGVASPKAGFLALTGIYGSSLGNNMNVTIKDNAVINGKIDDCIDVCTINTKYDQIVDINVESEANLNGSADNFGFHVYDHDECAELVSAIGKTLAPETNYTDLTITIDGQVMYPDNTDDENDGE